MISAKFLWGNVPIGGKLQLEAKRSNCEISESALYIESVRMPLNLNVYDTEREKALLRIIYIVNFESIQFLSIGASLYEMFCVGLIDNNWLNISRIYS